MNAITETKADHATIYAALAAAAGEIKRLGKESRNVEQKYDFASVDDFLAMTGPICAANGLVVCMDEDEVTEFERQGKWGQTFWLRIRFLITVHHVSGKRLPPVRRTVEVIRTGAQSFGSAQSYALKQFLRALFQIPTGDKDDADYAEKGEGQPTRAAKNPAPKADQGPSDAEIAHDKALTNALVNIEAAPDLDALAVLWKSLPRGIQSEPKAIEAKDKRKAALNPPVEADEIPY